MLEFSNINFYAHHSIKSLASFASSSSFIPSFAPWFTMSMLTTCGGGKLFSEWKICDWVKNDIDSSTHCGRQHIGTLLSFVLLLYWRLLVQWNFSWLSQQQRASLCVRRRKFENWDEKCVKSDVCHCEREKKKLESQQIFINKHFMFVHFASPSIHSHHPFVLLSIQYRSEISWINPTVRVYLSSTPHGASHRGSQSVCLFFSENLIQFCTFHFRFVLSCVVPTQVQFSTVDRIPSRILLTTFLLLFAVFRADVWCLLIKIDTFRLCSRTNGKLSQPDNCWWPSSSSSSSNSSDGKVDRIRKWLNFFSFLSSSGNDSVCKLKRDESRRL